MTQRQCYYIDPSQGSWNEELETYGYIPSIVREHEPGHYALLGSGEFAQPWYWGATLEDAQAIADKGNHDLGLTPDDVIDIMASSIRASELSR